MASKTQPIPTGLKALIQMGNGLEWLTNKVDAYLVENEVQRSRVDPGWFHPSSLADPCDARLAFEFLGIEKKEAKSPVNIRVLHHGHQRDAAWKEYVAAAGLSIFPDDEGERPDCLGCGMKKAPMRHICIPALRIRGELDDIVQHPVTGEQTVIDYKTKRARLFAPLEKPDAAHILQVNVYMQATGVHNGGVLYECSDDKTLKIHPVPLDNDLWLGVEARVKRILATLAEDGTPTRTPGKFESSCAFYHMCATARFPELVDAYREKQGLS